MLDHIRGLHEKLDLLDCALGTHDGFAILEVVLFLWRTIKPARFAGIMRTRPVAADLLLAYWRRRYKFDEAAELLTAVGRFRERALLDWWRCYRIADPAARLAALTRCAALADMSLASEAPILNEQIELLQLQLRLEAKQSWREAVRG